MPRPLAVWLAAGVRTPFAKIDGPLAGYAVGICADGGQGSVLLLEAA
jgi:hypothetical protein